MTTFQVQVDSYLENNFGIRLLDTGADLSIVTESGGESAEGFAERLALEFAAMEMDAEGIEITPAVYKPPCKLINEDGNIFNLLGLAIRALKNAGLDKQVENLKLEVMTSDNYSLALTAIGRYVEIE